MTLRALAGQGSVLLWIPCATRTMCLSSPVLAASLTCGRMNVSKPLFRPDGHVSPPRLKPKVRSKRLTSPFEQQRPRATLRQES